MKVWLRNFYFILAVVVFLSASAFFVLLASGYNYNFLKNKFEKTSVLYIKSYPRSADIFLNEELYKENTPAEIFHLKPNMYNIEISKEGYQHWSKEFLIKPEETVFIEEISLFYKNVKISTLKNGNFESLSISPDQQNIFFYDLENKELNIFNLNENNIINIEKNIELVEKSLWSSDSQKVLLKIDNNYFISFIYFNEELLNLNDYLNFIPQQIVWDKFDSNIIYLTNNNKNLYKFNIQEKILENTGIKNVLAIKPEKNILFYITSEASQKEVLYVWHHGESEKILDLGVGLDYKFVWPYKDYICLLDSNNTLYLIDPNDENYLVNKFYNIKNLEWDLYNRTLLLANDFEIWSYDALTKEETLISRFSTEIQDIFWHHNNNHIFYITEGKVYIIELDNRDKKNVYPLDNLSNADLFLSNRRGNVLYYISPAGLTKGIIQ